MGTTRRSSGGRGHDSHRDPGCPCRPAEVPASCVVSVVRDPAMTLAVVGVADGDRGAIRGSTPGSRPRIRLAPERGPTHLTEGTLRCSLVA